MILYWSCTKRKDTRDIYLVSCEFPIKLTGEATHSTKVWKMLLGFPAFSVFFMFFPLGTLIRVRIEYYTKKRHGLQPGCWLVSASTPTVSHRTSAAAPVSHQPAVEHGCVGGRGARPQRLCLGFHFLQSDDDPHTKSLCGQYSLWSTAPYYGCMNLFTYHQLPTCLGQCTVPSNK